MSNANKTIVLASGSPRRKEILSSYGIDFKVIKSGVEENSSATDPAEYVCDLAKDKGLDVYEAIKDSEDAVIISADTIVYYNGILEKPKDRTESKRMLRELSGNTHQVYTGVFVIDTKTNKSFSFAETTDVTFYEMSDEDIEYYVQTGEGDDKAGAYAIQGLGTVYIKKIDGDYNNVVGLPLARLYQECNKRGIRLKNV